MFENKAKESGDLVYSNISNRLIEVFKQIVMIIKEDFRSLRTRNNNLPQLHF